ncbi:MAG: hypothetical protein AAFW68_03950, partial [Pseudomonadota bacterium]
MISLPFDIILDPLLPPWAMSVALAAGVLFSVISLWRNWKSGIARVIAIAAVLALLSGPLVREAETAPLNDIALILVDESAS